MESGMKWRDVECMAMQRCMGRLVLARAAMALLFVTIVVVMGLLLAPPASAEAPPEGVSIMLILDNSGSMKTNDPNGLRFTAARLFLALLDEGDAANCDSSAIKTIAVSSESG